MNERGKNVIEGMVSTGMDMDTLLKCLSQFPEDEIKAIYDKYHARKGDAISDENGIISINCS